MPRVIKPSAAQPVFIARPHSLSENARRKLLELAGYEGVNLFDEAVAQQFPGKKALPSEEGAPVTLVPNPHTLRTEKLTDAGKMILDVEMALGIGAEGAEHLDKIPRPADYVATFEPIRTDAGKLLNTVANLTGFYRDHFTVRGEDVDKIAQALATLFDVSGAVIKQFEGRPSKGPRKALALAQTVHGLQDFFKKHYRGPRTGRKKRGSFEFSSEEEKKEFEFVRTALRDARLIPATTSGDRKLKDLMRDRPI